MTQADSTRPAPVAIIGMGCLFPMADDLERYWSNIRARLDAITDVPPSHWRPEDYHDQDPKAPDRVYAHRGGFLSPVDFPLMDFGIAPHAVEATDTTQLLGLIVARKALEDAGYGSDRDFNRDRVSVILGVTGTLELVIPLGARLGHPVWRRALAESGVDSTTAEKVVQRISDSYVGWQEASFPGLLGNVTAGRIANRLNLGGTNCVVDAACASSLGAVNLAMHELATGRCDVALSGGVDTFNDIFMYMCFSKTPALSPTGHARPFSAAGDGTTLGEGLGIVVLKRLEDARRDGDKIYAVIRSMGTSSDGKGQSIYAPKVDGQAKALRQAYDLAGVAPGTIELVEAHGTGTRVGDGVEVEALEQVYRGGRSRGRWCALGSVKSQIGHTKAAAGSAGLIKAALALYHKVLPPTIKVDRPIDRLNSEDSPFYLNTESRPWAASDGHPRRAAVSAFGFGGSNFHCVLEEAETDRSAVDWGGDVQILAYSAAEKTALAGSLPKWSNQTTWAEVRAEAGRSRRAFQSKHRHRLLIVTKRGEFEPSKLVEDARARLASGSASATPSPESRRMFLGEGEAPGRLAFLFPGQGSQYVGMLRDLACRFPQMLSALELADKATEIDGGRLGDLIYPPSVFSDDERRGLAEALRDTRAAQPAIGAISMGLLRILEDFGVRPDMAAGHSFGELSALLAAGRIDAETFAALASDRGALMAHCAEELEPGAMLAAFATADQLAGLIDEHALDVVIANKNAPRQNVLSGSREEIDRAGRVLAEAGITAKRLPVSAAFHSRFVSEASAPFRAFLDGVSMREGSIPVFANSTGEAYPSSSAEAKAILADQLAQPVEFAAMIEAMHRAGARTFVEVGPDSRLCGLVGSILEGENHLAVALDPSRGDADDLVGLATALATLAAAGRAVNLGVWDGDHAPPASSGKRKGLTVSVCGAHPHPSPKPATATTTPPKAKVETVVAQAKPNGPSRSAASQTSAGDAIPDRRPQPKSPVERTMNPSEHQPLALTNGHAARGPIKPTSAPAPATTPPPAARSAEALRRTHEHLLALQQLAHQTARLHQQFLEGQETAQRTFQTLLEQQARLAGGVAAVPFPAEPIAAPSPEVARRPEPPRAIPAPAPLPSIETAPPPPVVHEAPAVAAPSPSPVANGRRAETPAPAAPGSDVGGTLLAVVAEKTGYPVDMLELGMRLDDDLGIDSIKRVEILSALQERIPEAPAVRPDQLGAIGTLGDIVELLGAAPAIANEPKAPEPIEAAAEPEPRVETPTRLDRLAARPLPLDHPERREALAFPADAEIWVVNDGSALTTALEAALAERGLRPRVVSLDDVETASSAAAPSGLIVPAPAEGADSSFIKRAFRLIQTVGPRLRKQPASSLVTVSRLDGRFGFDGLDSSVEPYSGGLAGLAKTAGWEWPEVHCKAVDLDLSISDIDEAARRIVEELSRVGPSEVGLSADRTIKVELERAEWPAGNHRRKPALDPRDLVVVTGGARGVTAEAAVALAAEFSPTLLLLGRTPAPEAEPSWLAGLSDEAEIRAAIRSRSDEPLTPQKLNERFRRIIAQREVSRNLERIQKAGGAVIYRAVDVRDRDAIRKVIDEAQAAHGPVRGLIHAAGVLADRRIEDQTDAQFDLVYDTKIDGLLSVFEAIDPSSLRVLALYSSSTARFGRVGQVAYAAANEVLNKWAQVQARRLPDCRVASFNWGPWDGGMVTPSLRALFESEGLGLISLAAGADLVVREVQESRENPVEIVVLADPTRPEPTRNGDGARASSPEPNDAADADLRPAFERVVDLHALPVLRSHVIDDHAVLPMALIMEWLGEAAVHRHPGLVVQGVDDLRLFKGVVLRDHAPITVSLLAGKGERRGPALVVPVEMRGAMEGGRDVVHAKALIHLADRHLEGSRSLLDRDLPPMAADQDDIYERILFHGPAMRAIERIEGCDDQMIAAKVSTAPAPGDWIANPLRGQWLTDPLAVDAAFQVMVLWCRERTGSSSLPTAVGSYRQFQRRFPADGVRVLIAARQASDHRALADIEFLDARGGLVARIESYECVIDASLNQAFRRNRLAHLETTPK